MENFKPAIEKKEVKLPDFGNKMKEIISGAKSYIKLGVGIPTLLLFSMGHYETASAQNNPKLDTLSEKSLEWFDGKINSETLIENSYSLYQKDDSFVKFDTQEKEINNKSSFEKKFSGKDFSLSDIKTEGDTLFLGNVEVSTFGATATNDLTENGKENLEEISHFSCAIKTNVENTDTTEHKIQTLTAHGSTKEEAIMNILGTTSNLKKSNVIVEQNKKDSDTNNQNTEDFKNLHILNSDNIINNVKILVKKISDKEYSATIIGNNQ